VSPSYEAKIQVCPACSCELPNVLPRGLGEMSKRLLCCGCETALIVERNGAGEAVVSVLSGED
jgi:hypothetical protein